MFSSLNNLFKFAATGILIFLLGSQVTKYRDELLYLKEISPGQFFLITIIVIASIITNGSKLKALAKLYNIHLKKREVLCLSAITTTLNNFFFKAGSLFTSNYLKQRYEFPFMSFAGSQGADHLIIFFINALCGMIISLVLAASKKGPFIPLTVCYLSVVIFLLLIFSKTFDLQHRSNKFFNSLILAVNSLFRILKNKRLFYIFCAHNIVLVGLNTLRFFIICNILALNIPITYCLLFITLVPFISAIPIIYSDIGTRELIIGMCSQWLGLGFETGMLVTLLDRFFVLIWASIISLSCRNLFDGTRSIPSTPH